ncbi:MAG: CoA pyrophosphatase [Deltaproteobacteria bacterium]|nr:CoA pyrophosphatase [Deltaproteobacteria bacterium]
MGRIPHLICDNKLLRRIQTNIERFDVKIHPRQGVRRAAVAITVVDVSDDPGVYGMTGNENKTRHAALILTRRSAKLKNHPTQWAFPGGQMDAGESAEDTALRELDEEVGLQLDSDRIIGRLDDFTTRSGFVITPVVAWGGRGIDLTPNPAEVSSIHRIPIEEFLRDDAPLLEKIKESQHPVLRMPVGSSWIAAPTAAIIYQFREVAILGKDTRVAHYEQPHFAWS